MDAEFRRLNEIDDYEDFSDYAIDVEGILWSLKYKEPRKRKLIWSGKDQCAYLTCRIRDDYGQPKTVYIHKLVAQAFLPCDDTTRRVKHKNEKRDDNRLENLEWVANIKDKQVADDYILHRSLVERILQVHIAAQKKGLKVGDSYNFTTQMLENAIEAYIMQYGLRKLMPTK